MRMLIAAVLTTGLWSALCLAGDSPAEANRPPAATQPATAAAAYKPYIPPEKIYEALAGEYAPCQQKLVDGAIDWSRGRVIASGSAHAASGSPQDRLKAQRGAEVTAIRNAILAANGIRASGRGKFGDLRKGAVEVDAVAKGREVVSNEWDAATLTADAKVSMPMYGITGVVRLSGLAVEKPKDPRALEIHDPVGEEADLIVIDARNVGSKFQPLAMPRIEDEKGRVIFDASSLSAEQLAGGHMAVYVTAPEQAARPAGAAADSAASPAANAATAAPAAPAASSAAPGKLSRRILLKNAVATDFGFRYSGGVVLGESDIQELSRHGDAMELLKAGRLVIIVGEDKK